MCLRHAFCRMLGALGEEIVSEWGRCLSLVDDAIQLELRAGSRSVYASVVKRSLKLMLPGLSCSRGLGRTPRNVQNRGSLVFILHAILVPDLRDSLYCTICV